MHGWTDRLFHSAFTAETADNLLTHWGWVTHICVSRLTITGSDNGLSPGRRHAIIWTNAGILVIRTLGTNFSEILGEIHSFSFSKMHLKILSATWRLFGLGLNELSLRGTVSGLLRRGGNSRCLLEPTNSHGVLMLTQNALEIEISRASKNSFRPPYWGRDKIDAISQTTFSNEFSWMKMYEYRLKFHWSLFLRVQFTISQHWFR